MIVIMTGGGTGGHLYPALAIAEKLFKTRQWEIHFIGTARGLESRVVPEKGYAFHTVWIAGLQRGRILKNVLFPLKMAVSLIQACRLLIQLKPGLVVGTGGYVSWPVLAAAALLRIPTAIQEQNQAPGLVTKLFASRVEQLYLSFKSSKQWYKRQDNLRYTGNPTRDELEEGTREQAMAHFGLNPMLQTLFVFGGSQGAKVINEAMIQVLPGLMKRNDLQILWGTGPRWIKNINQAAAPYSKKVFVLPYIDAMNLAYRAADLILCRSGATTVAEITRLGLPAIYIPFAAAAGGHQEENARILHEAGAAKMIVERELNRDVLENDILDLIEQKDKRKNMAGLSRNYGKPRAADEICDYLTELAKK